MPASRSESTRRDRVTFAFSLTSFHLLGFAGEAFARAAWCARGSVRHGEIELPVGFADHAFEFLRFGVDGVRGFIERAALRCERGFECRGFLRQALQQFAHRRAVALVPSEHELRAGHRRVRHGLDGLCLFVEFDGDLERRFGCGLGGAAEARGMGVELRARLPERAFRSFDGGFQLCGAAGNKFAGARGGIGERARDLVDALAFLRQACGDGIRAHIGTRACFVECGDIVFEHAFECAQPRERTVETGIQRIEFAPHRAAQARRCARGGFVRREELVGCFGQRLRRRGHREPARERPGAGNDQHRRHEGRKTQNSASSWISRPLRPLGPK